MDLVSPFGRKWFSPANNRDSLLFSALGFYFIYLLTKHSGIGLSPDSIIYLSVARNFKTGHGLIQFDHVPLADFPVLYPIFLGIISIVVNSDPLTFAPVLNGFMFAILIYLAGSIMNEFRIFSRWYKLIVLSAIVMSPALLEVYPMLWSETLFILLLLVFFIAARSYFLHPKKSVLISLALIAGLASITRYAGVTVIGCGCVLVFLDPRFQFKRRIRKLLVFAFVSSLPLLVNLIRNRLLFGYSTGMRQKGTTPLLDNLYFLGSVFCDWLPLPKERPALSLAIALVCIMLLIYLFYSAWTRFKSFFSFEEIAITFSLIYIFFILLSATISRYEQLNSRLLSPVFIPVLWSLSYRIPIFVKKLSGAWIWIATVMIVALTLGFQYNQLTADYETYDGVKDAGVPGYTEDPFPQSDIVKYIVGNKSSFQKGYMIYSNAADAFYLFTSISADVLPQVAFPHHLEQFYAEKKFYLIWFNDIVDPDIPMLKEILDHRKMTPVAQLSDGSVWISVD